jgi:peroxiredoxin
MIKRGFVFSAFLTIIFLAAIAPLGPVGGAHAAGVATAPDFTLKDLDGKSVRLSDFRGRNPVLLVFSTTWCPHCRAQVPLINDIYAKYKSRGLQVYHIDIQEPADRIRGFVNRYSVTYPVLLDNDAKVSKQYKVVGVPANVLINKEGSIVCNPCRSVEKLVPSVVK